jgi:hypothetical protein
MIGGCKSCPYATSPSLRRRHCHDIHARNKCIGAKEGVGGLVERCGEPAPPFEVFVRWGRYRTSSQGPRCALAKLYLIGYIWSDDAIAPDAEVQDLV